MESITKPRVCADVDICHTMDDSSLFISAALPGVRKSDVKLNMTSEQCCISGERDDLMYDCCYLLPHEVVASKSDAHFENGLLTIKVPFKKASRGRSIDIH